MSEQNANNVKITSVEDAWKIAAEEGYKGTLEEYTAIIERMANEINLDEKLNVDEMESVAGGGFTDAMEAVGDWFKDNAVLVGVSASGIVAAVGAVYLMKKGKTDFNNRVHFMFEAGS